MRETWHAWVFVALILLVMHWMGRRRERRRRRLGTRIAPAPARLELLDGAGRPLGISRGLLDPTTRRSA